MSGVGSTVSTVGSVTGASLGSVASTVIASQTTGVVHEALAFTGFTLGGYAIVIVGLAIVGLTIKIFSR